MEGCQLLFDLAIHAVTAPEVDRREASIQTLSTFRLLGYLIKHREGTHFYCSDEYDAFCRTNTSDSGTICCGECLEPLSDEGAGLRLMVNKKIGFKRDQFGPRSPHPDGQDR